MIICEYCQTQLPGHSFFCCQCGRKVHLPGETIVYANFGPALKLALRQKRQAITHYAGPGSPLDRKLEHELHQTYNNRAFNKPDVTANGIHITWEEGEEEDDAWI
jgi:chloramphenicol 3-O-phosphotransferase